MSNFPNFMKACFDFARLIGAGKNNDIVPIENLIRSMITILSEAVEGVSVFRYSHDLPVLLSHFQVKIVICTKFLLYAYSNA